MCAETTAEKQECNEGVALIYGSVSTYFLSSAKAAADSQLRPATYGKHLEARFSTGTPSSGYSTSNTVCGRGRGRRHPSGGSYPE